MIEDFGGYFWETLYIVKQMYDHGFGDAVLSTNRHSPIDGDDIMEFAWDAIGSVFPDTRNYYNEEREIETFVFFDPMFTEFYRLCEEYEEKNKLTPEKNTFRQAMERELRSGFTFNSYAYGWDSDVNTKRKQGCRLILLFDVEFYCHHEVPGGLLEVRDAFVEQTRLLKAALGMGEKTNILALPMQGEELKEAA